MRVDVSVKTPETTRKEHLGIVGFLSSDFRAWNCWEKYENDMNVLSGRHKSQGHNFLNILLLLNQLHNLGKHDCSFLSIWMNYHVHNLFFLPSSLHAWVAAYINFMTNEGKKKIPLMPGFQEFPVCELLDHVTLDNSYSMNTLGQRPCVLTRDDWHAGHGFLKQ